MDQQSLIYAFVARGTVVLAQYAEVTGNFTTIAAQFLQKLPASNDKFTYSYEGHTFNYLVEDGFKYCVVAVESVGQEIPTAFLERVKKDFTKKYGGGKESMTAAENSLNSEFGSKLKEHMQYCVDHAKEISKLAKVKVQVSEVKGVMMENIEKVPGMSKMLEDLCEHYKIPQSLILLGVPPPGDDSKYLVSTANEALSVSETLKAGTGKGKAIEKPIEIHCANFMAPSCAEAIEFHLQRFKKKEDSDLGHEPQVRVQNPSLLREKKKTTNTLEELMARFDTIAELVAQQVQDLPSQFEKANSLNASYSEIEKICRRSAYRVERLGEIKGSALEAFVITGYNGSTLTAEAAFIIRQHFHVEVEQMSDEDIDDFVGVFLCNIFCDNDSLLNEYGSLKEGITLDKLWQHVLYVLGHTHMADVILQCCLKVSKALEENIYGDLLDAQASETIRAQAIALTDLARKPSLIGCDTTVSVDLTCKGYDGSSDDSGDDVLDYEEAQEEDEEWEDNSDDDSVTSNSGHGVHDTASQSHASSVSDRYNAQNDGGSEESSLKEVIGNIVASTGSALPSLERLMKKRS